MLNLMQSASAPTWDEPIEMLLACHGKVRKFCHQLTLLPDFLAQNGVNQAACTAIEQIRRYFSQAAPLHHEDEEIDFFPALLKYAPQAQADVDELLRQHGSLHANWDALNDALQCVVQGEMVADLDECIARFVAGYDVHLAIEEPLFALGQEAIPEHVRRVLGQAMASRRLPA